LNTQSQQHKLSGHCYICHLTLCNVTLFISQYIQIIQEENQPTLQQHKLNEINTSRLIRQVLPVVMVAWNPLLSSDLSLVNLTIIKLLGLMYVGRSS